VKRHLPTFKRLFLHLFIAALLPLTLFACSEGKSPEKSWENAVKGNYSAALSNDGKLSVIGSITHGASLWDVAARERIYDWNHKVGEYSNIIASGFSPEGNYALTADHQTMVLWDTRSGKAITFWTAPNEVMSVELTPDGNFAFLGLEDYSAVLFDVKRGGVKRTFYHKDRVRSVALSADGKIAITGSEDQTAKLWNIETGEELFSWQHNAEVHTVAITPSGDKAFSMAKYDNAVIWDTQTGRKLGQLPLLPTALKRGQLFTSAEFSPDGSLLLTGTSDRLITLWDVNTLEALTSWTVPKRDAWKPTGASIIALSFSDQPSQFLAISSNGFTHRLKR
jgi:WD40 repeat protein